MMADLSPLTNRYKTLSALDDDRDKAKGQIDCAREMDRLFELLVNRPSRSVADVIDKLAFADFCLTEEFDPQEAAKLIRGAAAALLVLHVQGAPVATMRLPALARKWPHPPAPALSPQT